MKFPECFKLNLAGVFAICCGVALTLLTGCGVSENALAYYNPTWSSTGRIYAIKETIKSYSSGGFGGSSQDRTSYVVIMNANGGGEQTLFNVGTESYPYMRESPSGNYLALQGGHGLEIRAVHQGYAKVSQINVDDSYGALTVFDWSPDESQVVIQTEHGQIGIYARTGAFVRSISSLSALNGWKYNSDFIGYESTSSSSATIKTVDSAGDTVLSHAAGNGVYVPVQFFPDGENVFAGGANDYQKYSLADFTVLETYTALKTELDKEKSVHDVQLNPVNPNELMFDQDAVNTNDPYPNEGIFLINLDGTNLREVKKY